MAQHALLFDNVSTNCYIQRPLILERHCNFDSHSKYDLLDEPMLQAVYRRLRNCETFQSILARASSFDLNETDTLDESLLFKAIRSGDTDLGGYCPLGHPSAVFCLTL